MDCFFQIYLFFGTLEEQNLHRRITVKVSLCEVDRILLSLRTLLFLLESKFSSGLYMREVKFSKLVEVWFKVCFFDTLEKILHHLEVHFSPKHNKYFPFPLAQGSPCKSTAQQIILCFLYPFTQKGGPLVAVLQGGKLVLWKGKVSLEIQSMDPRCLLLMLYVIR